MVVTASFPPTSDHTSGSQEKIPGLQTRSFRENKLDLGPAERDKRMIAGVKHDRGLIRVDTNECKGCGLCIEACPPRVIALSDRLNHYGYRTATYAGTGCTGCGICFLACPEPGAITVLRHDPGALSRTEGTEIGRNEAVA
jgi:2-oxoglutarate ferredoxin oxidoreductase subunit delta